MLLHATTIWAGVRDDAELMARMGFTQAEAEAGERSRAQLKAELKTVPAIPQADRDAALARARRLEAARRREETSRDRKIVVAPMPAPLANPTAKEAKQQATVHMGSQQQGMSDSDRFDRQIKEREAQFDESFKSPAVKQQEAEEKRAAEQAAREAWCAEHPVECAKREAAARREEEEKRAKEEKEDAKREERAQDQEWKAEVARGAADQARLKLELSQGYYNKLAAKTDLEDSEEKASRARENADQARIEQWNKTPTESSLLSPFP
jgi:hypothetical protein